MYFVLWLGLESIVLREVSEAMRQIQNGLL